MRRAYDELREINEINNEIDDINAANARRFHGEVPDSVVSLVGDYFVNSVTNHLKERVRAKFYHKTDRILSSYSYSYYSGIHLKISITDKLTYEGKFPKNDYFGYYARSEEDDILKCRKKAHAIRLFSYVTNRLRREGLKVTYSFKAGDFCYGYPREYEVHIDANLPCDKKGRIK